MLRRASLLWLFPPLLLLGYREGLGRSFTSEDFLILRRLGSGDFFERMAESFTGPWLGASFVPFYRPFSSLLLQLELGLFGKDPFPYLICHLLVHLGCTLLLAVWLGRLLPSASRAEIALAALIFGLYPLHPNTVLFIASFATLFATFFLLATLYLEAAGHRGWAMAVSPLALFSYEQAVMLPFLILLFDWAARPSGLRQRLRLWPYFAMTGTYLLLRGSVLGELGGYDGFGSRLREPAVLVQALADALQRLFVPLYAIPAGPALSLGVLAGLTVFAGLALYRHREEGSRVLLAALLAIPLVQAPFFFTGVVPANGRYFYLAAVPAAIVLWQGLRLVAGRWGSAIVPATLAVVAAMAFWGLAEVTAVYREAAERAERIRQELETLPPGRVFVAGRPFFAEKWGVPVAQIFHWGLADALEPPFTDRQDLDVFPLPELSVEDLAPLLNRPDLGHFLQLGPDDRLRPIPVPGRPGLLEAQHDSGSTVELEGPQNGALRLVVLAQGGPTVLALPPGEFGSGKRVVEVPADLLESMRRLYSAPLYIWIDSRDELGNTIAATPVFELPASPP